MTLGDFLQLMNADLQNEWTHLQFYLYHASSVIGIHAAKYREFFSEAAKGEMQHVQQFLDRLFGLHFNLPNSNGKQFPLCRNTETALGEALKLEEEVIKNYATRLAQLDALMINNPIEATYLRIFYEDQLQDSYEDCERIRQILGDTLTHSFRALNAQPAVE
jgi:bacterioferritin (cytochrome b1)